VCVCAHLHIILGRGVIGGPRDCTKLNQTIQFLSLDVLFVLEKKIAYSLATSIFHRLEFQKEKLSQGFLHELLVMNNEGKDSR
jgi:hypothetical protein